MYSPEERYLVAEKRELELRQEGHLAKILDGPLPDESPEELERLAEEDRRRAQEGLVELKGENGEHLQAHRRPYPAGPQCQDQSRGGACRLDRRATKEASSQIASH